MIDLSTKRIRHTVWPSLLYSAEYKPMYPAHQGDRHGSRSHNILGTMACLVLSKADRPHRYGSHPCFFSDASPHSMNFLYYMDSNRL